MNYRERQIDEIVAGAAGAKDPRAQAMEDERKREEERRANAQKKDKQRSYWYDRIRNMFGI